MLAKHPNNAIGCGTRVGGCWFANRHSPLRHGASGTRYHRPSHSGVGGCVSAVTSVQTAGPHPSKSPDPARGSGIPAARLGLNRGRLRKRKIKHVKAKRLHR